MKLASIRLVTRNVPALAAFYTHLLGAAPGGSEDFAELELAGGTLAICSERSVASSNAGAATAAANRSVILEFAVADVDAERARLAAHVTDWVLEPTDQPWGNRSMLFRDPDGNLLNFFTPPASAN